MEGMKMKPQRVWPLWLVLFVVVGICWCFLLFVSSAEASGWVWRSVGNGRFVRAHVASGECDGYWYQRNSHGQYVKQGAIEGKGNTTGWRGQVLELLKTRQEQQDWLESLQLLGLEGQPAGIGYGPSGYGSSVIGYGTQAIVPYAQQGSTVYGYSAFGTPRATPDVASLFNQASRLTSQAQELAGQATTDFSTLVQQEAEGQSRVAEIVARGQVAEQLMRTLDGPTRPAEFRSFQFGATVAPDGRIDVQPLTTSQASGASADRWLTAVDLLRQSCVGCHSAEDPKGGLDLSDVSAWTDEQRREWGPRIQASVVSGSMPKGDASLSAEDRLGIVLGF